MNPLKLTRNIILPKIPDVNEKDIEKWKTNAGRWMDDITKVLQTNLNNIYDDSTDAIKSSLLSEIGDIIFALDVGVPSILAPGAKGQKLITGGAAANPSWIWGNTGTRSTGYEFTDTDGVETSMVMGNSSPSTMKLPTAANNPSRRIRIMKGEADYDVTISVITGDYLNGVQNGTIVITEKYGYWDCLSTYITGVGYQWVATSNGWSTVYTDTLTTDYSKHITTHPVWASITGLAVTIPKGTYIVDGYISSILNYPTAVDLALITFWGIGTVGGTTEPTLYIAKSGCLGPSQNVVYTPVSVPPFIYIAAASTTLYFQFTADLWTAATQIDLTAIATDYPPAFIRARRIY